MKLLCRSILSFFYIITAHDDHQHTITLSHNQFRNGGDFVGYRRYRGLESITVTIFQSSLVLYGLHSGDTDGHVHSTDAPRPPKTVADNHRGILSGTLVNFFAYFPRRAIGIFWQ